MPNKNIIKIGSKVIYRGTFGMGYPEEVTIEGISKCEFEGDKNGTPIDEIPFDEKDNCIFDLDNRHWCYGKQIDSLLDEEESREDENEPKEEFVVRITFRSEIYIKGKTMEEIKNKWDELPLFSADALETYNAEYIEMCSVERIDDGSYDDVIDIFD